MASAYSISRQYNKFVEPIDLSFMVQAMANTQQKFDKNWESTLGQIEAISNLDIVKDSDKKYLYDRTNELIKQINQYPLDMSSNGLTRQISTHIKQAVDDNVVNAIEGTKKMRSYQAEVANVKEKHPDKYSSVNEAYGFKPIYTWLNDGKVGSEFSGTSYTPFTNFKDVYDRFDKMATQHGDDVIEIKDGKGGIKKTTYNGLKPAEIRTVVEQMMTPQEQQQLNINGWYNMGQGNDTYAQSKYKEHVTRAKSEVAGDITLAEADLGKLTVGTPEYKDKKEEIDNLKTLKSSYNIPDDDIKKRTAEEIGGYLEREKLIGGIQTLHNYHIKSETYGKDDLFWENQNYNLDVLKYNLDVRKQEAEEKLITTAADTRIIPVLNGNDDLPELDLLNEALSTISSTQNELDVKSDAFGKVQWGSEWDNVKAAIQARAETSKQDYHRLVFEELNKQHAGLKKNVDLNSFSSLLSVKEKYSTIGKKLSKLPEIANLNPEKLVRDELALPGAGTPALEYYLKVNPNDNIVKDLLKGNKTTEDDAVIAKRVGDWFIQNPNSKKQFSQYIVSVRNPDIKMDYSLLDELKEVHGNFGEKNKFLVTPVIEKGKQINPEYQILYRLTQSGSSPFDVDPKLDITFEKTDNGYTISQTPTKGTGENGTPVTRSVNVTKETFEREAPTLIVKANKEKNTKFSPISTPVPSYYSDGDTRDVLALMGGDPAKSSKVLASTTKSTLIQVGVNQGIDKNELTTAINKIVNNASKIRISTVQEATKSGGVKVAAYIGKNMIGSTIMDIGDYNNIIEAGRINPQILLSQILQDELLLSENKEIPSGIKSANILIK
jgi:hypothetical protein